MQSHEPQQYKPKARAVSAAPTELNLLLSVRTQGFISGFALIPPWAMQECRPVGALLRLPDHFIILMRLPW